MDVPLDELELLAELEVLDELELDELLLEVELVLLLEEELELLLEEELELLDVPESQTAPATVGISAEPFPFVPWKPNSTYCPGWMFAFQPRLVAL